VRAAEARALDFLLLLIGGAKLMKLAILGAVILISISAGDAFACVCSLDPNPTPEKIKADRLKAFDNASAVFTGEVVFRDMLTVKFKVNKIWKGEASDEIAMLTGTKENGDGTFTSSSCDYNFSKGQKYLVYAYGLPGEMKTHACSRTASIKYAEKEMQGLDEIRPHLTVNEEPAEVDGFASAMAKSNKRLQRTRR
jgi:hypothetical protein